MAYIEERLRNLKSRRIELHSKNKCALEFTLTRCILDHHNISYKVTPCNRTCDGFVYFTDNGYCHVINDKRNKLKAHGDPENKSVVYNEFENLVTIIAHNILDNNGNCLYCPSSLILKKEEK